MKFVLYIIAAILALVLFLPAPGTTEIRNIPLLIVLLSLVAAYWVFKAVRAIALLLRTKRLLEKRHLKIERVRMFPFGADIHGRLSIVAGGKDATYNILLTTRKRKGIQYHFCDGENLELYKTSGNMFKTRYSSRVINVYVKKVGKQKLKWADAGGSNVIKILILDRFPHKMTRARGECELGNGDNIDGTYLYDLKGFLNYINTIR